MIPPLAPAWEPPVLHLLVQSTYAAAFAAGLGVDRRYDRLLRRIAEAGREAAREDALLASTRQDLERVAGHTTGIFTDGAIGRYRVGRLVGRGGMGEVYEATDPSSGQRVALKLIRRERLLEPSSLHMFESEAHALARVQCPYVAGVLDASGINEPFPYLVMEYIEGRSLAALLRERGRLALPEVRRLVADVAMGLRHAHEAGILHRDVKPQNLMFTQSDSRGGAGLWKLVDFGVANLQTSRGGPETIAGTPQYMAPEQARGERTDTRADLYSLCLVVYRALTGRPAFIRSYDRDRSPPDPKEYVPLSEDLSLALRIGLAAQPHERFSSAHALGVAFEEAFEGRLDPRLRARGRAALASDPWSPAKPARPGPGPGPGDDPSVDVDRLSSSD